MLCSPVHTLQMIEHFAIALPHQIIGINQGAGFTRLSIIVGMPNVCDVLRRWGSEIIFLDGTHDIGPKGYQLVTVLVRLGPEGAVSWLCSHVCL